MSKLKPYVETILFDHIVPLMFITMKDVSQFTNDPIEYIRSQYDFAEATYQAKNQVQDLLCYLVGYSEEKKKKGKKVNMLYLPKFLDYAVKNLNEYNQKI